MVGCRSGVIDYVGLWNWFLILCLILETRIQVLKRLKSSFAKFRVAIAAAVCFYHVAVGACTYLPLVACRLPAAAAMELFASSTSLLPGVVLGGLESLSDSVATLNAAAAAALAWGWLHTGTLLLGVALGVLGALLYQLFLAPLRTFRGTDFGYQQIKGVRDVILASPCDVLNCNSNLCRWAA